MINLQGKRQRKSGNPYGLSEIEYHFMHIKHAPGSADERVKDYRAIEGWLELAPGASLFVNGLSSVLCSCPRGGECRKSGAPSNTLAKTSAVG